MPCLSSRPALTCRAVPVRNRPLTAPPAEDATCRPPCRSFSAFSTSSSSNTTCIRGRSPKVDWQRVFGGQVIGQALVAAQRTVEPERHVHSLHGYFMRPGDTERADHLRGRPHPRRRQLHHAARGRDPARPGDLLARASFQVDEDGLEHQMPMPPTCRRRTTLLSAAELLAASSATRVPEEIRRYWERERPIEMRPVILHHYTSREKLRAGAEHLDPRHRPGARRSGHPGGVLAYLSDMTLLDTSTFAHGRALFDPDMQVASLDHAMWFHRPPALDDWLLYTQDSPSASGARGFTRGSLYAHDGTLVASVAQEGLIRLSDEPAEIGIFEYLPII